MRVIMFQPRFEEPILQGIKGSTIRKTARCKEGDVLSLRDIYCLVPGPNKPWAVVDLPTAIDLGCGSKN